MTTSADGGDYDEPLPRLMRPAGRAAGVDLPARIAALGLIDSTDRQDDRAGVDAVAPEIVAALPGHEREV